MKIIERLKEAIGKFQLGWHGISTMTTPCGNCGRLCTSVKFLGYSKENVYLEMGCKHCGGFTYLSIDTLKHKPRKFI